ncbi:Aldehyde-alcohol dehydrogenase (Includes: Alcohol dehydrogenase; Acetaldehyde dehydrogenase (acetylating); Pyruvate-formate-lyase deactivase) [Vibrio nigripulchritudo MADA3029]|uniref:bifunctional acetaldehyde-CoA/alcohol dehydrogenase n=1 Tax=Vibrio nigripulchritudo TaxID=28173 RepID=UPI0003B1DCC4|nr:bifunctional acetaldehyde-CoA/alcohol dehydrogenase [Vibrio nigripulchritudo]CCN47959.1 Aldehyde-alcohol dehydrogenase (Includes: Alcohol dehydrogenase; Acetaldehyde dehydrogenase (acetylating); Pyruvate-formate-lyase deactivase) [Vibrio nigripulchritudo MADA3020]CCN52716.1 Aldehyde-alcohol dehydrogenase (Includes: Alcohol dehydrogenase; Acetaldehyde dehydrogenase (acetylating); Pyruvate-formate-lyase deactivase) [Vibrio nigripulchritudo MADA3021]CCN59254.1 Aldehyde-alcohol dehydrogenase (Inc
MPVTNLAELDAMIARVKAAQAEFATYSQEQVDKIFRAASLAANQARIPLAQQAVEESGMGIVEDKVIKNHFASEYIYNKYKDEKTCGILDEDESLGTMTIAEPAGIICGIVPTTNPTSTAIFKSLISLKTRNAIIFSPHPRAKNSTNDAAKLVLEAAVAAGAPKDIIGWIDQPSVELSNALMKHDDIALILATGGPGMVKAAYSSGKPAIGVGAGNVPVVIDESADIKRAVASILMSKTFDNGVVCASEQAAIVVDEVYDEVKERFASHKAYVLSKDEAAKVRKVLLIDGNLNAKIVGQPAPAIAEMAGVAVPADTKVLVGEGLGKVSYDDEFAHEKLSPTLGLFRADDFEDAVAQAVTMVEIGGIGHTSGLYTDQDKNADRVRYFGDKLKTARILINIPTTHGGIGDLYNFNVAPSLTLGCGSWGGNSISENVGPKHLINKKTVAKRAENMLWHKLPKSVYFRRGSLPVALGDLEGKKRAFLVTDRFLFNNGYADETINILKANGMEVQTFFDVEADPVLSAVQKGADAMNSFQPDVIIALGGGSPMDAAKIMWVMYEHPETAFEDLAMRFMDIRKRIYKFPKMGQKAEMVCIPTTSGTGSEVTPFAVVTDDKTGAKYPLADYELTPQMAIVDANLVMNMPKSLCAFGGYDAVTHALEAYVSVLANEYSDGQALQALKMLKEYLPSSYANGANDPIAREKVHNAATIAGIAFANAFLGVCHSMAHKIGAEFHLAHGMTNAMLIDNVVRYNANDNPTKQTAFSQYDRPQARRRYAEVADHLELSQPGDRTAQKIERLVSWLDELKTNLDIPKSIQAAGVNEADFLAVVDRLAVDAFDDQCTGANPRYPLISELKEVMLAAYYGKPYIEGETFEGTTVIKKKADQVAAKAAPKAAAKAPKKAKAEA